MAVTTIGYNSATWNASNPSNTTLPLDETDTESISTAIKDKIMRTFYISISLLGIVGNLLVLIVLLSLKNMRKKLTSLFIINQSVVDALTAVFLLMTTILPADNRTYKTIADDLYCRFWATRVPLWLCIHCSTYSLVALTLERFLSVVYPITHKMSFNRTKALLMVAAGWLIATTYNLAGIMPIVFTANGRCYMMIYKSKVAMQAKGIIGVSLVYFIPIFTLIYCYSRMAYALRATVAPATMVNTVSSEVNNQESAKQNTSVSNMKSRAKRNIIKTLMIVSTAFILCTSWNQWFFFLFNLGLFDFSTLSSTFYHFSVVAMFANCCVNPFIYAAQYEEFQKGLRRIFLKKTTDTEVSFSSRM